MTLKDMAMGQMEKALVQLKQLYYDKGNKAHSLLARKLTDRAHTSTPHQIKDRLGCLLSHPQDIASFAEYYNDLYNNTGIPHNPPHQT